jgi:hypothetical protein
LIFQLIKISNMKFFGIAALLLAATASAEHTTKVAIRETGIGPTPDLPAVAASAAVTASQLVASKAGGTRKLVERKLQDWVVLIKDSSPVPYTETVLLPDDCPADVMFGAGYWIGSRFGGSADVQALIDSGRDCVEREWDYDYVSFQSGITNTETGVAYEFDCTDQASVEAALIGIEWLAPGGTLPPLQYTGVDPEYCFDAILVAIVIKDLEDAIVELNDEDGQAYQVNSVGQNPVNLTPIFNGDPHVKTLGGKWFEYHGECDLVFAHAANFFDGKDMAVHARTTIRQSYSFITSAAVRLGESTLEVASYGSYALNGVDSADLSKETFEGYKINYNKPNKKNTIFEIVFNDDKKIVLSAFKDLVAIKMVGFSNEFANTSGLLGSLGGKLLGRDGVTEFTDMNAFGQEWQVRDTEPMLFRSARAPQFPTETCRLPKVSMEDTRRRLGEGMAREQAERACAHFSGVQFENCVFDVMAVGDIDLAQAGAY